MIEALAASVVLALSITAVTMPFTAGAQNERMDARYAVAVNLAQEMIEEILAKPFTETTFHPGPETGETRATFNCMDDYDGFDEPTGAIYSAAGTLVTDPAARNLGRHVTATYVYVSGQNTSKTPTFLRVSVEVRYQGTAIVTLSRLVYGMGLQQ